MTLTAIAFDSAGSAETHQEFILQNVRLIGDSASPQSQVAEGVLGDESYLWTADAEGVGSVVGFLLGPYVVQLHTTLREGAAPLVSLQDLSAPRRNSECKPRISSIMEGGLRWGLHASGLVRRFKRGPPHQA